MKLSKKIMEEHIEYLRAISGLIEDRYGVVADVVLTYNRRDPDTTFPLFAASREANSVGEDVDDLLDRFGRKLKESQVSREDRIKELERELAELKEED